MRADGRGGRRLVYGDQITIACTPADRAAFKAEATRLGVSPPELFAAFVADVRAARERDAAEALRIQVQRQLADVERSS